MLENNIIEPSNSLYLLSVTICTDFHKVNDLSETNSYPIPRMDDCIDKIGKAKYITKCDLLTGYWDVTGQKKYLLLLLLMACRPINIK